MRGLLALAGVCALLMLPGSAVHAGPLTIELERGKELFVASVGPWSRDYVVAVKLDGTREFVPIVKIHKIRDDDGRDLTRNVLVKREVLFGDSLAVPSVAPSGESRLRARPLPECNWFLLTQAGLLARLDAGSDLYDKSNPYIVLDYGAVKNLGERFGLGGNIYLGADDRRVRVGIKARARTWLSRDVGIDLAPGILLLDGDNWSGEADSPGFVGEASMSVGGLIQFVGQVESMPIKSNSGIEEQDVSWMAGARLSGAPGVAATIGAFAVGVALLVLASAIW